MSYTILSATYANADNDAAIAVTQEHGAVALSERDTPDAWTDLLAWGGTNGITAYEAPDPIVPDRVSSRQFGLQMIEAGIKDSVDTWIATQDAATQWAYERSATFVRDDPMMQSGFTALGFTSEQIDAFFTAAAAL